MPLHSALQQDCLALCGREPSHSCNQIRAGNASWNSQCSAEQREQLQTEPSQVWRSLSLCTLCLTNEALLLSGLKPALRVIQQLLQSCTRGKRLPGLQWHRELCNSAAVFTWVCVDADDPWQAQHCSRWSLYTCG